MASKKTTVVDATGTGSDVNEVLASLTSNLTDTVEGNAQLAEQFTQLANASQTQTDAVTLNTEAVQQNTSSKSGSGSGSTGTSAGSVLGDIFGSGLGLSPLISGLIGLFTGGGSSPTPVTMTEYVPPPSIDFDGTLTGGQAATPSQPAAGSGQSSGGQAATPSQPAAGSGQSSGGQQITIQVQTMDSQSFMDHSDLIAQAVRQAMLNMNSVNDVVNDL